MADEKQESKMRESWVSVGEDYKQGGLSHVKSSEEMMELLAEASTEEELKMIVMTSSPSHVPQDEEVQYRHSVPPESEPQDNNYSIGNSLRSFIWTLLSPPFLLSHLTAFLIGLLIGRRMLT